MFSLRRGGFGQGIGQRTAQRFAAVRAVGAAGFRIGMQALHDLQRKGAGHAAGLQAAEQGARVGGVGGRAQAVAQAVCHFTRRFFGGHAFGQAAQVFHQHHTQRGGQGPQLALRQRVHGLVGHQEFGQQPGLERAVGMRHIGPGDGVHAGQPGPWPRHQHRQAAEVAARQAVMHLTRLRDHQVNVVQQPFTGGADMAAVAFLLRDGAVRNMQHLNVFAQARKKRRCTAPHARLGVGQCQAVAVLLEAGGAQQFGAQRGLQQPALGGQQGQHIGLRGGIVTRLLLRGAPCGGSACRAAPRSPVHSLCRVKRPARSRPQR